MTAKQKQCLLAYLGYYHGAIDGAIGPQTRAAVEEFQRAEGLTADGSPGPLTQAALLDAVAKGRFREESATTPEVRTGTFWDEIQYFSREEFRCPCPRCGGFPVEPKEALVRLADQVREHFGEPATVSSGVRCQAHNDELPGSVPNSYHVKGQAVDFSVRGKSAAQVLAFVRTLPVHYAYAIDNSFVHMDVY